MAKFYLTLGPDYDLYDTIHQISDTNNLDEEEIQEFVSKYIDCGEQIVTIQFDTETQTCIVLPIRDAPEKVLAVDRATEELSFRRDRMESQVAELHRQVVQMWGDYQQEPDKNSSYTKGLLKNILDTHNEIKKLREPWAGIER